jgi:uncharacterized protein
MKIGVISDTHGSVTAWHRVMETVFNNVDMILHAGDLFYYGPRNPVPEGYAPGDLAKAMNELEIPLIVAKGNCDSEVDQLVLNVPLQNPFAFCQIGALRILVNHGHELDDEQKISLAHKWKIDLMVCGHTHLSRLTRDRGVVLLNPGSPALPKEEPTVALIDINKKGEVDIKIFNIDTGEIVVE